MTYKQKLEAAAAKAKQGIEILNNPDATPDEKASIDALMQEAEQLKTDAMKLKTLEEMAVEYGVINEEAVELAGQGSQAKTARQRKEFADFSEYVVALVKEHAGRGVDERLRPFKDSTEEKALDGAGRSSQKAMTELTGAAGGFLVPEQTYSQ